MTWFSFGRWLGHNLDVIVSLTIILLIVVAVAIYSQP